MGQGDSMVIVLPGHLPMAENYTVSATPEKISLRAGWDEVAVIPYSNEEVFARLLRATQIGLVEFSPPGEPFPNCITNVAYVETRRH